MGKIADRYIKSIENNREITLSTLSKPKPEITDPRFQSQSFRDAVRIVLEYFGHEQPTFKDFREVDQKFDGRIDWLEFARRISHPRFLARVYVLDNFKNHCAKIGVTLFGDTKDEALKTLSPYYEFVGWFDENNQKPQNSDAQDSITEDIEAETIAEIPLNSEILK